MAIKLYPSDTLAQAHDLLITWDLIDPALKIGSLTQEDLAEKLQAVNTLLQEIDLQQTRLIGLRNERDAVCIEIYDIVKRARAGIKGIYGDDSTEYEIAGGTRRSDRKKPRRTENF